MAPTFSIAARDPRSRARAGTLHTAHGDLHTPAFVPLATKATVKGLLPQEVAAMGYQMVLGNTFHLMLRPGEDLIRRLGGLHRFMDWDGPIVTDSGGFQVFSMGHGTVADEIKSRRGGGRGEGFRGSRGRREETGSGREDAGSGFQKKDPSARTRTRAEGRATSAEAAPEATPAEATPATGARAGAILEIAEQGVRFRSYVDGRERLLTPEGSMAVQAALGSDIALVFDECTPFKVDRDYTARSTARTHRWLQRCLRWHAGHGPPAQLVYGIVQGGVYEDLRRASTQEVAASGCHGVAIGGSLGSEKAQMYEVVGHATRELGGEYEALPRHLLGIGDVDDLIAGVELGIDTFDCAMPTRLGRHGTALVPEPGARWRLDLTKGAHRESPEPLLEGCPCPACSRGLSRAYLSYLARSAELTGMRLLTAHNLVFLARLMRDLRDAIHAARLAEVAAALRAGAAPGAGAETAR